MPSGLQASGMGHIQNGRNRFVGGTSRSIDVADLDVGVGGWRDQGAKMRARLSSPKSNYGRLAVVIGAGQLGGQTDMSEKIFPFRRCSSAKLPGRRRVAALRLLLLAGSLAVGLRTAGAAPLELRGVVFKENGASFGVLDRADQSWFWVALGQTRRGVRAVAYDQNTKQLTILINGRPQTLALAEAVLIVADPEAAPDAFLDGLPPTPSDRPMLNPRTAVPAADLPAASTLPDAGLPGAATGFSRRASGRMAPGAPLASPTPDDFVAPNFSSPSGGASTGGAVNPRVID
jgi:hypothetical protein